MSTDVITLITSDHRKVEALFARLQSKPDSRKADVAELAALLTAHARAEEDRVYPTIRETTPSEKGEIHHSVEEHKEAEILLDQLKATRPDSPEFDGVLKKLVESVTQHVKEEENEILPALAKAAGTKRLQQLGKAFKERRDQEMLALRVPAQKASPDAALTKEELYEKAKAMDLPGRSRMTKRELAAALGKRS
ncbi:hemerythrin domain-containing protein [Nonomuraea africana]|uniref:Hemerythrin superfamily protein n=1 Tax=Nonomuraea africana TaxID=46171 RepID=A0ABR9KPX3_9ACTN|nr:hemerythrin domain-containing protein [Nonomuraea africana]MBE1564070.1 hemerythrin superfamily protein [Nonomuraea africana]